MTTSPSARGAAVSAAAAARSRGRLGGWSGGSRAARQCVYAVRVGVGLDGWWLLEAPPGLVWLLAHNSVGLLQEGLDVVGVGLGSARGQWRDIVPLQRFVEEGAEIHVWMPCSLALLETAWSVIGACAQCQQRSRK